MSLRVGRKYSLRWTHPKYEIVQISNFMVVGIFKYFRHLTRDLSLTVIAFSADV